MGGSFYRRLFPIMPFSWNKDNLPVLKGCIKYAAITLISDFHSSLKSTKQSSISYKIKDDLFIDASLIYIEEKPSYDTIMMLNNFYYDLTKFFMFLKETIPIDYRTIQPIQMFLGKLTMKSVYMKLSDITTLLHLIDDITYSLSSSL